MFDRAKLQEESHTTNTLPNIYVALDLGQKNIHVVLKNKDGKIIKENKIQHNTKTILEFINENSNSEKNNKNHNNSIDCLVA